MPDYDGSLGDVWGYRSERPQTPEELELIEKCIAASRRRALYILRSIDPETQYTSRLELGLYLTSLVTAYPKLMDIKASGRKTTLGRSYLYAATAGHNLMHRGSRSYRTIVYIDCILT